MKASRVEQAKAAVGRVSALVPAGGEWPIGRIVAVRIATYAALVTVLVIAHPVHPWSMVATGLVLMIVVVWVQHRWRLPPPELWDPSDARRGALTGAALAVGGLLFVVVGIEDAVPRDQQSLHSGLLFMGLASTFLGAGLLESILRRKGGRWYVASAALLAGAVIAYLLGLVLMGRGWWTWLPLVALLVSPPLVGICSEWVIRRLGAAWPDPTTPRRALVGALAAVAALLVAARAVGFVEWWVVWWLVPVAPAVALVVLRIRSRRGVDPSTIGLGLAAVVVTAVPVVLVEATGFPAHLVWLLTVLALLLWFIVVDNEIDVLFIVVLAAVVWSGLPRSVDLAPEVHVEPGRPALVALGDSFISGEGARTFFDGTNVRHRNECRRAPTAYPVLLAAAGEATPDSLTFLACSGARASQLVARPQYPDEPIGGPDVLQSDGTWGPGRSQLHQLSDVIEAHDPEIEVVLVSIGGNDSGFGTIARTCFAPGPCTDLGERWVRPLLDDAAGLPAELDRTYAAIAEVVGDAPVVVVPYPIPLAPHSCEASTLADGEHRFLHDFTVTLNAVIEESAARAGFAFAGDVADSLLDSGEALCAGGEPGVNWVDLNPVGGSLSQTANPRNWLHNSLHPNERGHRTIATVLDDWLDEHLDDGRPAPDPDARLVCNGSGADPRCPDLDPPSRPLPDACVEERPDDPDACERVWMLEQVRRSAPAASVALGILVVAQWFVGVQLVAWWRGRSDRD